ncbi:thermonuclease family protein [Polymorphobacter fuscus]|uniref:Thermonuclease family protein n=1 Tax=Sandarakinorhabdus fusca TaxID=1439888 RepID=A0A7C9KGR8_9SPHN|nr:thermonuclease family protein [Polymorphobacter fuscus]MQT15901.1 thermonuclease family protein [Polymorphobacter fuscus]
MPTALPPAIICERPWVSDGDTLSCRNLPARVRMLGIDAPELPGHCNAGRRCTPGNGAASKRVLIGLVRSGPVLVKPQGYDRYDRILARVSVNGVDLSCAMLARKAAVRRYAMIACPKVR